MTSPFDQSAPAPSNSPFDQQAPSNSPFDQPAPQNQAPQNQAPQGGSPFDQTAPQNQAPQNQAPQGGSPFDQTPPQNSAPAQQPQGQPAQNPAPQQNQAPQNSAPAQQPQGQPSQAAPNTDNPFGTSVFNSAGGGSNNNDINPNTGKYYSFNELALNRYFVLKDIKRNPNPAAKDTDPGSMQYDAYNYDVRALIVDPNTWTPFEVSVRIFSGVAAQRIRQSQKATDQFGNLAPAKVVIGHMFKSTSKSSGNEYNNVGSVPEEHMQGLADVARSTGFIQ